MNGHIEKTLKPTSPIEETDARTLRMNADQIRDLDKLVDGMTEPDGTIETFVMSDVVRGWHRIPPRTS